MELKRVIEATWVFLWSRAAIWIAAIFTYQWFLPHPPKLAESWDRPEFHDLGWGLDIWARWDSEWFIKIARDGYEVAEGAPAFFPLYPSLVSGVGWLLADHFLLAGVAVSLLTCWIAFVLLDQLAADHLDEESRGRTLVYFAIFPMTIFLQAVYSEAVLLALVLGAFLLAERGFYGWAGVAVGLALLTKATAFAALPALGLIAWPSWWAIAKLVPGVALFAAYPLILWNSLDDPLAFISAEHDLWGREGSIFGPLGGLWLGLTNWVPPGNDSHHSVMVNLEAWGFIALFAALAVVAWRRLGAPYGLFCGLSLAIPLSAPSEDWPLQSLPRFCVILFPAFMALGLLGARPRVHMAILIASGILLGIVIVQWTQFQWVS